MDRITFKQNDLKTRHKKLHLSILPVSKLHPITLWKNFQLMIFTLVQEVM